MNFSLHPLSENHAQQVQEIFNFYVENSFAAFPSQKLPVQFLTKLLENCRNMPALGAFSGSEILAGFGFMRPYHQFSSFNRSAEVSYFISESFTGRGIGSSMLSHFEKYSRNNQIDNLIATISSRNEKSINFHQKNGFNICGVIRNAGRKFSTDFDLTIMQKILQ